jgi:predicted nucleotidyltransferase
MGKNAVELLFPKIRREVLAAMLLHPQRTWYLSKLARHLDAAPSHLHRELAALTEAGILTRRAEGRQTYFAANPACPLLPELTGLLRKTMGARAVLEQVVHRVRGRIRCAFIYGSIARGTEDPDSDVDFMVVGRVSVSDLLPGLRRAERVLGRPVNPTVYPARELAQKFRAGHHFIRSVINDPHKAFVIGGQHDLEEIIGPAAHQTASHRQSRAGRPPRRGRRKDP